LYVEVKVVLWQKRLSGYNWDVGWSEGVMDAEESGKYIEKAELSCIGRFTDIYNMFEHVW